MTLAGRAKDLGLTQFQLDDLRTRHAEPQRHYHTWNHLEALHRAALTVDWHRPDSVWLAILYHDAVYEPGRKDNEHRSAELLRESLTRQVEPDTLAFADALIRWTHKHVVPDGLTPEETADAAHFLDIDMGILGVERDAYARYASQVRQEFKRVPGLMFNKGRAGFLVESLRKDTLFYSRRFQAELDAAARANMRWELETHLGRAGRKALSRLG